MADMKIYNTMSRSIENFEPMNGKQVRMYTCGLTVYSQPQIGNWVAYIYSDVLTRTLRASGFDVTRVQNITDVGHLVSDDDSGQDKMEKGARSEGKTAWEVADKYITIADDEAYNQLGLLRPTKLIRATELIDEQIAFVERLEKKGFTYVIPDEGVYFDTTKLTDYGKLARLDIAGLQAGARVDISGKRHITDFALWKFSPKNEKRDMEWDSPWGTGFPGWHLECSVIAMQGLGEQIDLHTGGIDHIPVHHTNEIAQTEALTGKTFVNYWFHNNFIKIDGTKLSKSLGNSYTLDDLKKKGFSTDSFKTLVLSSHYQTEGNFTWQILESAQNRLKKWQSAMDLRWQENISVDANFDDSTYSSRILDALQNNLDTPLALSIIDEAVDVIEQFHFSKSSIESFAKSILSLLGIDLLGQRDDITESQKQLLNERAEARKHKDWDTSDLLRTQLLEQGIEINDMSTNQRWIRLG